MSCAKSCIVLQKTQRASSELVDSTITASAKSELKRLISGELRVKNAERFIGRAV